MTADKILLLKLHECGKGLDDDAARAIAEQAELLRFEDGQVIHQASKPLTQVYLIVQGQVRQSMLNIHGHVIREIVGSRGDQFGGLAAALAEPIPIQVVSLGPSAVLRFEFSSLLELTLRYANFRQNLSKLIARNVRRAMFGLKERKPPTLITFYHESAASRELTRRLLVRLRQLGEFPCLLSDSPDMPAIEGVKCISIIEGTRTLTIDEIRHQVHDWGDRNRIILDLQSSASLPSPRDVLMLSEQIFWCLEPGDWEAALRRFKANGAAEPVWHDKINIVWLLSKAQPTAPLATELRRLAREDFKLSFDPPDVHQGNVLVHGVERLVHQLRGVRIGIALGGGAARGMAHLGVLKALEQNGIVIDMIAGTSAGAMTGTLIAAGMDPDYAIKRFAADLTPPWIFRQMPRGNHWYLLYKYRRGHFDPMLRKYLKDICIEQMPLPMRAITVDLVSGRPVVLKSGDAVRAIVESINLPVLSSPICRDGQALVDGGLVNNVPADVLVSEGCNFVIAVSVTAKLESRFGQNQPDTPTPKMKSPSSLQTIMRSYVVQSMNMNSIGVQPADIVVEPDVTTFDLTEFKRTPELAAIGERFTIEAIPKIKLLLNKIDASLFA